MTFKIQCLLRGAEFFIPASVSEEVGFPVTLVTGHPVSYGHIRAFIVRNSPRTQRHILAWLRNMPARRPCIVVI
jgi:hypothetical protein